jgi:hypothetical protein
MLTDYQQLLLQLSDKNLEHGMTNLVNYLVSWQVYSYGRSHSPVLPKTSAEIRKLFEHKDLSDFGTAYGDDVAACASSHLIYPVSNFNFTYPKVQFRWQL